MVPLKLGALFLGLLFIFLEKILDGFLLTYWQDILLSIKTPNNRIANDNRIFGNLDSTGSIYKNGIC